MRKFKFLVVNGPNLNMLGKREPHIYGSLTLPEIQKNTEAQLRSLIPQDSLAIDWFQSNIEGEIVGRIQQAHAEDYQALVINPGAYSHTSVAILDALKILNMPIIEVHLSNTHTREEFRQTKLTAKASSIVIEGAGAMGYYLAIYSQIFSTTNKS